MKQISNFEDLLKLAQKKGPCGIAVAYAHDKNTIHAVKEALESGLVKPELFGDKDHISSLLEEVEIDLAQVSIVHCPERSTAVLEAIRSVSIGNNQILMKGTVPTGTLLKPILDKSNGLNTGKLLSHLIVLDIPGFDRLLISSDGGLNVAPSLAQKEDILYNALHVARALGIEIPKAAILAAIETVNPNMQATVDAACLCKMADRGAFGNAMVEGPLAIDTILSAGAAKKKGIQSEVCGQADIIIAPSIETANVFSKTLNYLVHSSNAGLVVGAKCPIILPSRASDAKSKYASLALGVVMS